MTKLSPHLHLDGTTREALEFYRGILGGEVQIVTVGEMPGAAEMEIPGSPSVKADPNKVMHATLTTGNWVLMAADMMDPSSFSKGDNVSLALVCESKKEIETIFEKLSAGGSVFMPLSQMPFGWFAAFTDKSGVDWMVQYGGNE